MTRPKREPGTAKFHSLSAKKNLRRAKASSQLLTVLVVSLAGCANPGPPKPPSLHLPEPVRHLTAERVGDHVILSWQTSANTTDGQILNGPITAELCRDDAPKPPPSVLEFPAQPNPCKPVHELKVEPTTTARSSGIVDRLPANLAEGDPRLIAYRVTLQNVKGRSAGPSAPVYAVAGRAPQAAGAISISPRRGAALIRWERSNESPAAPMQVTRTLIADANGPVEPRKPAAKNPFAPVDPSHAPAEKQAVLTAETEAKRDSGGIVDPGIRDGDTVTYVAQRVLRVQLTPAPALVVGRRGKTVETRPVAQTYELKSDASPQVTFSFSDVIAPAAPLGLASIAAGGFGELPSIDLSWEPSGELDLLGYNVYRESAGSPSRRLNTELIPGPEFRDLTAEAGIPYQYRVTAVDRNHHESAPSTAVKVSRRQ